MSVAMGSFAPSWAELPVGGMAKRGTMTVQRQLINLCIFVIKEINKKGKNVWNQLQPTFTPGSINHPGLKVGYVVVAHEKINLVPGHGCTQD